MENIFRVCNFLINKGVDENRPITNISLQKMLYFAQGFHLAEKEEPLFDEDIYAWKFGPVVREVYHEYKYFGNNYISRPTFSLEFTRPLSAQSKNFLQDIWNSFKRFAPFTLVEMTHRKGSPWYDIVYNQHGGHVPNNVIIPKESLKNYFQQI